MPSFFFSWLVLLVSGIWFYFLWGFGSLFLIFYPIVRAVQGRLTDRSWSTLP